MKKITLALCACAFALTGLLASCSNESTSANYIDRSENTSNYKYAVNGTIVTTNSNSWENAAEKVTAYTTTSTSKVDGGFVTASWSGNENRESNYTEYNVSGNVKTTKTTKTSSTYDDKAQSGTTSETSVGTEYLNFKFIDVDGTKYISLTESILTGYESVYDHYENGYTVEAGWYPVALISTIPDESYLDGVAPLSSDSSYDFAANGLEENDYVWIDAVTVAGHAVYRYEPEYTEKITKTLKMDDIAASEDDDAFSGDFGGEFSINIKISSKDENLSYRKENGSKATNAKTVEYKLTFVPVEAYDSEDFAEED